MRVLRFILVGWCLLVCDRPAIAADPPPASQVEHVPPEEALGILGSPVAGPDGKPIGRLVDVLVDATGTPEAGVIDVGGFMGVGARKIAVHWSVLHFAPANPKQPITLDLSLDQIKAAPEYRNPAKPAPVVLPAPAAGEPAPDAAAAPATIPATTREPTADSATPGGGTSAKAAPGPSPPGTATGSDAAGNPGTASGPSGIGTGKDPVGSPAEGAATTGGGSIGGGVAGSTATNNGAPADNGSMTKGGTANGQPASQTPPRPQ